MPVTFPAMYKNNPWQFAEDTITLPDNEYKRIILFCLNDIQDWNKPSNKSITINDFCVMHLRDVNNTLHTVWMKCLFEHMLEIGLLTLIAGRMEVSREGEKFLIKSIDFRQIWVAWKKAVVN